MAAPPEILELIARFQQQIDSYKSGDYNETQLRREFLDPFFKALGWDIDNTQGYAEAYKDVVHEDAIRIAATRTPQEKTALERQISATDSQIDRLVYDLYGLTEDEIKIVEGQTRTAAATETEQASETKPRNARAKSPFARAPKKLAADITPEKAYADAAHYYGKEEAPPYRTNNGEEKS